MDHYSPYQYSASAFNVAAGSQLTLRGLTLQGGRRSETSIAGSGDEGGAILSHGQNLTLDQVHLNDNRAYFGAAVFHDGGPLYVVGSHFSSNQGTEGVAIHVSSAGTPVTIRNSSVGLAFNAANAVPNDSLITHYASDPGASMVIDNLSMIGNFYTTGISSTNANLTIRNSALGDFDGLVCR